ncbi:hypothetical protein [Lacrimispora indolis]|uniref:hypothetical protein n=1 Tax=Lacrimispora indolis TaxID=69825 RepID=UPI00040F0533|nr:hypothetical protein [[Clostridium] methoxybenzovorans]
MAKFELSSKKPKNGKKYFRAILHEIYPDDCIINEAGTLFNENGITYLEKYTQANLDSIKDMSITCEFINTERTEILGHGMTGIEDGIPIFENATMIGNFTNGYIDTVEIDHEQKKVCVGEGYFDYMRYKSFIDILESRLEHGEQVEGSVEFTHPESKKDITYLYGWKERGRIPIDYDYTGYALLAIRPSDKVATLVEINNKENIKEDIVMDEKQMEQLVTSVKSAIAETNSKNSEYETKIAELNTAVEEKNAKIEEMDGKQKEAEANSVEKDKVISELNETIEKLSVELNECKKDNAINELNSKLEKFTDDELKVAEAEINSFKEDFNSVSVESIVTKINAAIGEKTKETQIAEINAAKNQSKADDIFGFVDTVDYKEAVVDLNNIFE